MAKCGALVGTILAARHDLYLRPFADKPIALLENFAAQVVMAIGSAKAIGRRGCRPLNFGA